MSTNRFSPKFAPLRFDASRAFAPFTDFSRTQLIALNESLEAARHELLADAKSGDEELAFVARPDRMLAQYQKSRSDSELGHILALGKRLRDTVDRVVVLDGGGGLLGARALFDAGCHPYHNELSRGDRGGRPKIYFVEDTADNDMAQGLLDLLCHERPPAGIDQRWALLVVDEGSDELQISPIMVCLVAALQTSSGGGEAAIGELLVPASAPGGCFSVLAAGGLLPAAVMGLDIVRLLQGAAMMNERFRTAPPGDNPVLDYVGVSHVMESAFGAKSSDLSPWVSALEAAARWCGDLRWQLEGHDHSPEPVGSGGGSGGVTINLVVDSVRRDRLVVPSSDEEEEGETADAEGEDISGKSLPELQSMVLDAAREAYAEERRPCADLHLPAVDESALGQFFQLMMLATAVEMRLPRVFPDGLTHRHA